MNDRDGFNTSADVQAFGVALASIAAAHSKDLDKFTINVWYRALRDVPLERLQQSTVVLVNGEFFPKPIEWREAVDALIEAEAEAFRLQAPTSAPQLTAGPSVPPEPYFDCNVCEDTCWERFTCDATQAQGIYPRLADSDAFDYTQPRLLWCGRREGDCRPGHSFVKRCACYPNNPTWRRRNPPAPERYAKRGRRERGELRGPTT